MAFRPFQDKDLSLTALQDEMNRVFDRVWHSGLSTPPFDGQEWAPLVDVYESADGYTLYAELAGVDARSVDVSYVGCTLTIRGEKTRPAGLADADRPLRGERRFGTFCRTVELPGDIDAEKLSASCNDGVLEITVPKSAASRPKTIKIEVREG